MRNKHQKCRVGWSLIVVLALLLSLVAGSVPTEKLSAASSDAASVFLDPPSQPAGVGDRVTVDIKINHVSDLYGAEVHLAFDRTLLKVVDADLVMDGVQIAPSTDFFPFTPDQYYEVPGNGKRYYRAYSEDTGGYFIARAEADNVAGTISYAFTLLDPAPAVSVGADAMVLATITFERKAPGTADINFVNPVPGEPPVKLPDAAGNLISILTENIHGAVILQDVVPVITLTPTAGPPGTVVTVAGIGFAPGSSVDVTFDGASVVSGTTHTDGSFIATFTVPDVAAGNYTVTATDAAGNAASATFTVVIPTEMVNFSIQPPTQTVGVGQIFTVDILVDASIQEVDVVEAYVDFDITYLKVVDAHGDIIVGMEEDVITPGLITETHLTTRLMNRVDNVLGRADIAYGMPPGGTPAKELFVLGTIHFKALAETTDTALTFHAAGPRDTMAVREVVDVTGARNGGNVTIMHKVALRIEVSLQGRPAPPNERWIIPVDVWLHAPDAPWTEAEGHGSLHHFEFHTSDEGIIELMVAPGTYDIRVKGLTTLKNLGRAIEVIAPGPVEVYLGILIEGDVNADNMVTGRDFSAVIMSFGFAVDDPKSPPLTPMCDFNNDGYVTGVDFSAVVMNFGLAGADIEE